MDRDPDILDLFKKLFGNWKLIAKFCGCGFAIGLILAVTSVKTYTVTSELAPEIAESSRMGSLASLSSLLGAGVNVKSTTLAVYPELYPEVVESTPFLTNLLTIPVTVQSKGKETQTNLYGYLCYHNRKGLLATVLSLPFKAVSAVAGRNKDRTVPDHFCADSLTKRQDKAVRMLRHSMKLRVDSKKNIVTLVVKSQNPQVALDVSRKVIEGLEEYVTDYYTRKEREDVEYYKKMCDEARVSYLEAHRRYASYADAHQNVNLQSALVERDRLQNEFRMAFSIYNSLNQNLQAAQAKLQENKPVIVTIEPPVYPYRGKPSRSKTVILWTFIAGLLACAYVIFLKKDE